MEKTKRYSYLTSEIDTLYHEAALKLGVSDSAMRILYSICMSGETCPLSEIVRLSGISKQTISSALHKLEREGIVRLSAEGKKKRVCLTDAGKDLAGRTALRILQVEDEIFTSWTEEECAAYMELTEKYLRAFKEKIGELR